MIPPTDPEHGPLVELVGWLGAPQAEMISSDLRDLKIPAMMRRQMGEGHHPESGEKIEVDTGAFEVLVPEAFLEISHEVLDATHLQPEGDTPTEEILEDLAEPAPKLPTVRATKTGRASATLEKIVPQLLLAFLLLGVVLALWSLILAFL